MSVKPTSKVDLITLSEYNKRYGSDVTAPLYVMNRTEPRGRIAFNAMGELNQPIPVIIEPTFIPVDLTTSVPRETLLTSSVFRRMLSEGSLVVVDSNSAESVLANNPRAQAEYERLFHAPFAGRSNEVEMDGDADSVQGNTLHSEDNEYSSNPYIDSIIHRILGADDENQDLIISDLLGRIDTLSVEDLETIRKHINVGEIVDVVVEELSSRNEQPEPVKGNGKPQKRNR